MLTLGFISNFYPWSPSSEYIAVDVWLYSHDKFLIKVAKLVVAKKIISSHSHWHSHFNILRLWLYGLLLCWLKWCHLSCPKESLKTLIKAVAFFLRLKHCRAVRVSRKMDGFPVSEQLCVNEVKVSGRSLSREQVIHRSYHIEVSELYLSFFISYYHLCRICSINTCPYLHVFTSQVS